MFIKVSYFLHFFPEEKSVCAFKVCVCSNVRARVSEQKRERERERKLMVLLMRERSGTKIMNEIFEKNVQVNNDGDGDDDDVDDNDDNGDDDTKIVSTSERESRLVARKPLS